MTRINNNGYIAITITFFMSLIILLVALSAGTASVISRANVLDFQNKQISYTAVRSCLDRALIKLALNSSYGGNESLAVGSQTCTISTVTISGSNKIIQSRSQVNGATTNLKLTVNSSTLAAVSLEEF